MSSIDCPYCLAPQSFSRSDTCDQCKKKVSRQYIEITRTKAPIYIVTYGPPSHGKSTLLASITFLLERLGKIAPRAFHIYLDDYTIQRIADIQRGQQAGEPNLGATPSADKPEPLLVALKNFPKEKESQVFVIFDLAGEVVDKITNRLLGDVTDLPTYAKAVTKAKTIWFIVSLWNIQGDMKTTGKSINNLFWGYQQTMAKLNVPLKSHDILVIYTKADLLQTTGDTNQLNLPLSITDYLVNDPYFNLGNRGADRPPHMDIDDYTSISARVSDTLRDFTQDEVPGGSAFVAMAEDSEVNLYFTINSAQGSASGTAGAMGTPITRYRVLDPLLWTITQNSGASADLAAAIILPAHASQRIASLGLPTATYDALRTYNVHAATYFAGETREAYPPGSLPFDATPLPGRTPLIGPILERLPRNSVAVVVVDDVLPLDIDDFAFTSWDDRLLLVGTDKAVMNARVRWKFQVQSQPEVELALRSYSRQLDAARATKI